MTHKSALLNQILKDPLPIRATIFTRDEFAQHAITLASSQEIRTSPYKSNRLAPRFEENVSLIALVHSEMSEMAARKEPLTPGSEWLLDNYHLVEEQIRNIRKHLPRGYYRTLPKVKGGEFDGFPRVYLIAQEFVLHCDASIDNETLAHFVSAYQKRSTLTIGELWAIPIMLRLALIEQLRRVVTTNLAALRRSSVAEQILAECIPHDGVSSTQSMITFVKRVDHTKTFAGPGAADLLRQLRLRGAPSLLLLQWFEERLREQGKDPDHVIRSDQQNQAANQITIGNTVTSLRTLASLDWHVWFERMSPVHTILSKDPLKAYLKSDFSTRDNYRHHIEKITRLCSSSETQVAESAIALAERAAAEKNAGDPESERKCHVGYYLIAEGRPQLEAMLNARRPFFKSVLHFLKRHSFPFYSSVIVLGTMAILISLIRHAQSYGAGLFTSAAVALLFIIPCSELVIQIFQWLITKVTKPYILPRFDFEKGPAGKTIPVEYRTLVAINALLHDEMGIRKLTEVLEVRFLGNQDDQILYALLADLPDSPSEKNPHDDQLLKVAHDSIHRLNQKYFPDGPQRFFILHRKRLWNGSEGKFMGWERKRGKLMELNQLLLGSTSTSYIIDDTTRSALSGVRFVLTLDTDSILPKGAAAKLIGALAHPLNRPILDQDKRIVVKGYGILQPRIGTTITSAAASTFARIFSGHSGLDPYTKEVSDVYQDLFHEGSYVGKGIYDLHAFEEALRGRAPENALLSHDLFEGLFARVALASHIEFYDEFPSRLNVESRRVHRWVRGDWQLLPWIFRRIPNSNGTNYTTPLSSLGRWKLIDNLRRSLIAPLSLLGLPLAFTTLPGGAGTWALAALSPYLIPRVLQLIDLVIHYPWFRPTHHSARRLGREASVGAVVMVLNISFLAFYAHLMLHAIIVTLGRLFITKKNFLEWQTAAVTEQVTSSSLRGFIRDMAAAPLISLLLTALMLASGFTEIIYLAPFLALWAVSPAIAYIICKPSRRHAVTISDSDRAYLEDIAFDTWSYFDNLMDSSQNYLIPDNVQMKPTLVVAERTSPTNVGLSIMSAISGYDFGFTPILPVIERLSKVVETLSKLERYHGHFINWCQTKTMSSLYPRYISTVDSGNLVGFLIAARSATRTFQFIPIFNTHHARFLKRRITQLRAHPNMDDGIRNILLELESRLKAPARSMLGFAAVIRDLATFRDSLEAERRRRQIANTLNIAIDKFIGDIEPFTSLRVYSEVIALAERAVASLDPAASDPENDRLIKIRDTLADEPSLFKLSTLFLLIGELPESALYRTSLANPESGQPHISRSEIEACGATLNSLRGQVTSISQEFTKIIEETDFKFLYDEEKKLFSIGYNLDNARRDQSFYDLFASEARLSSFVAIAKGDVSQEHWFMTNRSLTDAPGGMTLLSWSGTMFEYLMPLLVTKEYEGTLLSESYVAAVRTQKLYAKRGGLSVWGISESAFSRINFEKDYQYKAFGVPDLGLKRGLSDDLVISPYSTCLAISIDTRAAIDNLRALERMNMRGMYGFYESIDFTADRLSPDEKSHIVASFFAHHQGMSLVALNNFLNDGVFQDRFHADPMVKSVELLLHEKFPDRATANPSRQAEVSRYVDESREIEAASRGEVHRTPHTMYPRTRLLSNSRLSVMVDNAGSGHMFYEGDLSVTRWREDALANQRGSYVFLRDLDTGEVWSTTYQPTRKEPETYEVIFNPEKVEFHRTDFDIHTHTDITVSPEDDVEVRRVQIGNLGKQPRRIEVTSFAEVVLGPRRGDAAHPAFSKMFVQSEWLSEQQTLLFSRRKRAAEDKPLFLFHRSTLPIVWEETQYESSREKFIGRGRTIANPVALESRAKLSKTVGPVLDPVFSLRTVLELNPGDTHMINFITGVAHSREEATKLAQRYQEAHWIHRAFEIAWSQRNIELRQEQVSVAQMHVFEHLANGLFFNVPDYRAPSKILVKNRLGQSALWRFGISGDLPVVFAHLTDPEQAPFARELVQAHHYLRSRGVQFDLVLFNEFPGGYLQDFQNELELIIRSSPSGVLYEKKGGVFLRNPQQMSADEQILLQSVARIVLNGAQGSLRRQLRLDKESTEIRRDRINIDLSVAERTPQRGTQSRPVELFNGVGGFSDDGRGYTMQLSTNSLPPLPWSNVVANEHFGFLVTEAGGGFTWSENSREYRLTPWCNDPVSDERGEAIYLRDTSTGAYWSPTPLPAGQGAQFTVSHRFGWSEFESNQHNVRSVLTLSGSRTEKVKWYHLNLTNDSPHERTIEAYFFVDWVLGVEREEMYRYVNTSYEDDLKFLYATNYYNMDFPGRIAFMGTSETNFSYTANRREFIGRHGDLAEPIFFLSEEVDQHGGIRGEQWRLLSHRTGAGFQPCGLLKVNITIGARESHDVLFYLADAANLDDARKAAQRYKLLATRTAEFENSKAQWNTALTAVQVRTPERSMDIMLNGWLMYQTLACRLYGRSGFYQSGGAIGFRDQLQDVAALLYSQPQLTRKQILLHASRMFPEGDVQHWWHPPIGRGIRTKISDNYLWLPFVTARYIEVTGDTGILDEEVGFIDGQQLEHGHMETMFIPHQSSLKSSLYDHCIRALKRGMNRGVHGLPLMGGGDWNDGMNLVGRDGKGESVWLGWFTIETIKQFKTWMNFKNDQENSDLFTKFSAELAQAIDANAWDGEWYRRAFFDDGTPLGSASNDECQIDSLSQSWAVITKAGDPERADRGYRKACEVLVKEKIIQLLNPPFDQTALNPGYIKGYLAGIRENGGQYTHAATWMVLAAVLRGEGTRAVKLFQVLNPARHCTNEEGMRTYKGEPYVLCGDVYSMPPHTGRAGWSWYTGSSGWLYRVGIEYIAGLKIGPHSFEINPTIPRDWKGFEISFTHLGVQYSVNVRNPDGVEHGVKSVMVNQKSVPVGQIPYLREEEKVASVEVVMG